MSEALLPDGFAELEPFAANWAIARANQRALRRGASGEAERKAFYEAGAAALPRALALLDAKPLPDLDQREQRLMQLVLALAHVALAVEHQGDAEAGHAELRQHLPITRAPADA